MMLQKEKEIKKQTHFDIDGAIRANEAYNDEENSEDDKPKRRATPIVTTATTGRKAKPIIIKNNQ